MSGTRLKTILVVDVGNTSASAALYRGGKVTRHRRAQVVKAGDIRAFLEDVVGARSLRGAALATVVPPSQARWLRAIKRLCPDVINVDHRIPLGIPITFPRPETIGPDRLANAAGMASLYGTPSVAIDIGTALTMDIVLKDEGYVGGIIAPGPDLMMDYLADRTARLPRIAFGMSHGFIGKSTEEAMRIGGWSGYAGIVKELLAGVRKEIGGRRLQVCATGGAAAKLMPKIDPRIQVHRDLTLYGLGRIYEVNRP